MPVLFTKYVIATGAIVARGRATDEENALIQADDAHAVLLETNGDDETQYVLDGEVVERPAVEVPQGHYTIDADGDSGVMFPIPVDSRVRLGSGEWQTCSDGVFEFATDVPGAYEFHIDPPFPCRETSFTIYAGDMQP